MPDHAPDATVVRQIRDAPTRLFHWALVGLVFTSRLTQYEDWTGWHLYSGYAVLTLLVFRLGWGELGSEGPQPGRRLDGGGAAGPAGVPTRHRALRQRSGRDLRPVADAPGQSMRVCARMPVSRQNYPKRRAFSTGILAQTLRRRPDRICSSPRWG